MYNFTLTYSNNSVNNSGKYNISYLGKTIYENVSFPFTISFEEYSPIYNIEVTRLNCGTVKEYTLINVATTQFIIPDTSRTTKLYVPPTTLPYTSTTQATTTSTTTIGNLSISVVVKSCIKVNGIIFSRIRVSFGGNNSSKIELQIKDSITNEIVRDFDNVEPNSFFELDIKEGSYVFTARDSINHAVTATYTSPVLSCPNPSFEVQYIPNTCGKTDAKIRVFNISNATVFRYCYNQNFVCSNNFDTPDYTLKPNETEFTLSTNSGVATNYVGGEFITVRAFNQKEDSFTDVTVSVTQCTVNTNSSQVKIIVTQLDSESGNTFDIRASLLKSGKRYSAPVDVNISGYYTITYFESNSTQIVNYQTVIPKDNTDSTFTISKNPNDIVSFICINDYFPKTYDNLTFINNNPCS